MKMRPIPIFSAGITRQAIMVQLRIGTLWRGLPKCHSLAGLLWVLLCSSGFLSSSSSGRRVTLLGLDVRPAGVSTHSISTFKQRTINH